MTTSLKTAAVLETHMEIRITGSPEKVWKALTDDIGAWWPEEFYAGGKPDERSFQLEAEPGGRMYESWDGGGGVLWGTVVALDPGRQLQVLGTTFPNWGGPSIWFGTWTLKADKAETVLTFAESTIGLVSESAAAEKTQGWSFLFGGALKSFVEGRPAPAWGA